jgi:hypothetical protein
MLPAGIHASVSHAFIDQQPPETTPLQAFCPEMTYK